MGADCDVRFDSHPDKIVYAGQQVSGIVDINVHNLLKVRKLTLFIEGVGECEWTESRQVRTSNGGSRTERTYFKGRDQYLNNTTLLIPTETEIVPGHHTYNFMFLIAPGAPSSVNEKYGFIRYRVRVVFDRPWKFDLDFKFEFTVIRPLDLNLDPQLRIPLQQEEIKTFCCIFCASEPVILTASIPKTGFVVGQVIPVKVTVNNPTSNEIDHIEIKIIKCVAFTSQTPHHKTRHEEFLVREMFHGSSFHSCKKEYNIDMEVPFTVTSTCNPLVTVLNVSYMLKVKAKTPGCHMSPSVSFPITIGTGAIQDSNMPYNNAMGAVTLVPPYSDEFNKTAPKSEAAIPLMPNGYHHPGPVAPMMPPYMPNPTAPYANNAGVLPPVLPSAPMNSDLPPSFDEAMKKEVPTVDADTSSYNPGRQIGFVLPSSTDNQKC